MLTPFSKKNFIWNSLGAGFNAFHSPLFLMIVSRVMGIRDAGFFSLAFMTGVLLSNIGLFNVRSYQITDINRDHSDAVYLNARIVTAALMAASAILYSLTKASDSRYFALVLLLCLWRVPEVLSDVIHGSLQMRGRLDLAGKSQLLRAVLCIAAFAGAVYVTRDLVLACLLLVCVNSLVFVLYDLHSYRMVCPGYRFFMNREVTDLLRSCFPLFLISLLYAYLINAPRYSIDLFGTPENQTVFSIIVLPASMIWVVFIMVLNPILPKLAKMHFAGNRTGFNRLIRNLIVSIAGFSILYLALMYLFGIRIFEIVYKVPLMSYRTAFMIAGIGSGILCIATVFSNLLILIREKKILLFSYIGVAVLSTGTGIYFVIKRGLFGATLSYLITMALLMLALISGYIYADTYKNRNQAPDFADVPRSGR